MHQSVIRIGPAPLQAQQTSVIYKVATQSIPQDYPLAAPALPSAPPIKSSPVVTTTVSNYPVMDATVASSIKGEPELNIGKIPLQISLRKINSFHKHSTAHANTVNERSAPRVKFKNSIFPFD